MDLGDKVALVTGAARRVGRAIALGLARRGAGVIVHYGGSADDARSAEEEIRALGVPCWLASADLRETAAIDMMFDELRHRVPRLDVLVNSAAVFASKPFDRIRAEDWDAVMAVNLRAPFLLTQRAARWMREVARPPGESGLVVNLVDLSGVQAWCGFAHHGVSKAGLLHLTRLASRELAPAVRVNAVVPGAILPPPGVTRESEAWRGILRRVPLGRAGSPEQVADTVAYFAQAEFVTGAVVHLDGGERWAALRDTGSPDERRSGSQ